MVRKVVLAYSGGLDTSTIIPWLRETYGCEVIAFCADIGQGAEEMKGIEERAYAGGASKVIVRDLREEFLRDYVLPTVQAGAVYEGKYLLGTAMARPLIARHQVEIALQEGADAVAHGATGKGNDQVRFELAYQALAPHLRVIAPWREWSITSRREAYEYARAHGVPIEWSTSRYSRDRNLWHVSHEGGPLEDPDWEPADDVFLWTVDPVKAPDTPEIITLRFEQGVPVALNGQPMGLVPLMEALNALGAKHGIGRVDLVENRLVGMKSRGVYETPGGTILVEALRALETLCLDRETMHFKQGLALRYAELVYYGWWFSPLREAMDAFVRTVMRSVTGEVRLKLYKGNVFVVGRRSPYSLYREDIVSFDTVGAYDHKDAAGFIRLFGLPLKVHGLVARGLRGEPRAPEERD